MSMTTAQATTVEQRYSPAQLQDVRAHGYWDETSLAHYIDLAAAADPSRVAVTDGYGTLTRSELRAQAYRFALSLRHLGVVKGDRVQVQLPNWNEFVVIWIALARIGAVLVPTMPVYRDDEVKFVLDDSGAKISIVSERFRHFDYVEMMAPIKAATPALEHVIVVRGTSPVGDNLSFEDLSAGDGVPTDDELGPVPSADDLHLIVYTSGTESRPKGCQHTFGTLSYTAKCLNDYVFVLTQDDVMFMPTPITHATGITAGLVTSMMVGASVHLFDVWEADEGLRRIAAYRTTVSIAATPFLQMALAALKKDPSHDISSMRVWASAGAPIPEVLLREWNRLLPGCAARPVYGSSEVMVCTAVREGDPEEKVVASDGRSFDGIVLQIRDQSGTEVATGEEGEITYTSPGLFLGYWNNPERTAATIGPDGFAHSGDLGRVDSEGYLRVTGRIKDLIIRGGLNISAREVEENAATHPDVANVAAVSIPDDRLGEKVCAFIVAAGEHQLSVHELGDYLHFERHIAPQKWPEKIIYVDELPSTATGKIKKFELRQRALALLLEESAVHESHVVG
ncbi:cyclohexanecarboxylate-CoA ligase [Frondihabitans sp. PAMC 28766]|uniref:AMP-binding protein n=1 Tax=Frondihabitans sp. PAMC 28766 TaxID=1795630 RepID=UPI00078C3565|nr:AMP-binding protein [Frondihabitans sp. PAMC 28766]AMM21838.1 cyclohexanecarboxylate-CoA ligase [Frondihabitans sp. PAMC 28766]